MGPNKASESIKTKRKIVGTTIEVKREIMSMILFIQAENGLES